MDNWQMNNPWQIPYSFASFTQNPTMHFSEGVEMLEYSGNANLGTGLGELDYQNNVQTTFSPNNNNASSTPMQGKMVPPSSKMVKYSQDSGDDSRESSPKKNSNNKRTNPQKNAEKSRKASRDYRKRKKMYIESLEQKVSSLENEVKRLKQSNDEQFKRLERATLYKQKYDYANRLQEEWNQRINELELLFTETEDENKIKIAVGKLKETNDQLFLLFKNQHIIQLDFAIFANFALFGRDCYQFDGYGGYGGKPAQEAQQTTQAVQGAQQTTQGAQGVQQTTQGIQGAQQTTQGAKGVQQTTQALQATKVRGLQATCCSSNVSPSGFGESVSEGGEKREEGGVKGMDGVGKEMDVEVWRKLTEGMGVTEETLYKLSCILEKMRSGLVKLKEEHFLINQDLTGYVRLQMNEQMKDVGQIVQVTAKLATLQKNYQRHWHIWQSGLEEIFSLFTHKQLGKIWLRKTRYLENCQVFNSIWMTLNRQSFSAVHWTPAYLPPIPLPVHLCWPFMQ